MSQPKRKRVRAPADNLYLPLAPEVGDRARVAAARYGMSLVRYIEALVLGERLFPIPASHARLGGCILGALGALGQPEPDVSTAIQRLREAQRLGAEYERGFLPAFDAAHADEEPWTGPDRPERRNGAR